MKGYFIGCLASALSLTSAVSVRANQHQTAGQELQLTILVLNQAQVKPAVLTRAKRVAARIFRELNIETAWLECPFSSRDAQAIRGCQPGQDPTYLFLRVVPQFENGEAGFNSAALGFALPDQPWGVHASIFYHRVAEVSQQGLASESLVLGYALAHEIGHLLLGSNSHSPSGLMKARWDKEELRKATLELLRFDSEQKEQMRADVAARMERAVALRPGPLP
jgi:hypothetical protein